MCTFVQLILLKICVLFFLGQVLKFETVERTICVEFSHIWIKMFSFLQFIRPDNYLFAVLKMIETEYFSVYI